MALAQRARKREKDARQSMATALRYEGMADQCRKINVNMDMRKAQMSMLETQVVGVSALQSSVTASKALLAKEQIDVNKIADVMEDIRETLDDIGEITTELARPMGQDADAIGDDDVDAEFAAIDAERDAEQAARDQAKLEADFAATDASRIGMPAMPPPLEERKLPPMPVRPEFNPNEPTEDERAQYEEQVRQHLAALYQAHAQAQSLPVYMPPGVSAEQSVAYAAGYAANANVSAAYAAGAAAVPQRQQYMGQVYGAQPMASQFRAAPAFPAVPNTSPISTPVAYRPPMTASDLPSPLPLVVPVPMQQRPPPVAVTTAGETVQFVRDRDGRYHVAK